MAVDAKLGKASIAIRATLDQLDKDLAGARKETDNAVQKITKRAGKSFQTLGKVALGGIGVASGAVAGLTAALGKVAVDAMPVKGIQDAFGGIAESAGSSQEEMLAALEKGSSGMISQRDLMMSFNKAAQLVSPTFAKQLPDAMQYLSKVSAATGEDMGFMMDSLVTGVGRMSPMILDNLGIQVKLSDATEQAAEMFGVEASQLTDAQVQAGMMNVVLSKLQENTASMPDVTESAAATWARLQATFQNVKDQIGMALLPVLNTLMSAFGRILELVLPPLIAFIEGSLAPALQTVASVFGAFVEGLRQGMTPIQALQMALGTLGFPELAQQIGGVVKTVQGFIATAREVLSPVLEWVKNNVKLQDVLLALGAAIASVIIPVLISIVQFAAPVIAIFAAVALAIAGLRAAWESNFLGIQDKTKAAFEAVQRIIQRVIETVVPFVQNAVETITTWFDDHWGEIQEATDTVFSAVERIVGAVIQAVSDFIQEELGVVVAWVQENWPLIRETITTVLDAILSVVQSVLDGIKTFWENHGAAIMKVVQLAWDNIKLIIDTVLHTMLDIIKAVMQAITGDWEGAWETIKGAALRIWDTIQTIVGNAIEGVKTIIAEVLGATEATWGEIWDAIKKKADTIWSDIKKAVSTKISEILDDIETWLGDVKTTITDYASDLLQAGKDLIQGLIDGARQKAQDLTNAVTGVIGDAIDAAKNLLGIGSPSRLMMEFAEDFLQGFILGLRGKEPDVIRATEQVVEAIADTFGALKRLVEESMGFYEALGNWTFGMGSEFPPERFLRHWFGWLNNAMQDLAQYATDEIEPLEEHIRETLDAISDSLGAIAKIPQAVADFSDALAAWTWNVGTDLPAERFLRAWFGWLNNAMQDLAQYATEEIKPLTESTQKAIDAIAKSLGVIAQLPGALNDFGDALSDITTDAITKLTRIEITVYFGRLFGWFDDLYPILKLMAREVLPRIDGAANEVMDVVATAAGSISGLMDSLLGLGARLADLTVGTITELTRIDITVHFGRLHGWLVDLYPILRVMARETLPSISEEGNETMGAVATAASALDGLLGALMSFGATLGDIKTGIVTELKVWEIGLYFGKLNSWLVDLYPILRTMAEGTLPTVTEEANKAMDEASTATGSLKSFMGALLSLGGALGGLEALTVTAFSKDQITTFLDNLGGWAEHLYQELGRIATEMLPDLDEATTSAIDAVSASIASFNALLNGLLAMNDALVEITESPDVNMANLGWRASRLKSAIDTVIENLSFNSSEEQTGALIAVSNAISTLTEQISAFAATTVQPVLESLDDLKEQATSVANAITSAFDIDLTDAGTNMIDTLIAGIESRMDDLEEVLQDIRDMLPSSPAKTGPLSKPIDWGYLVTGLMNAMEDVQLQMGMMPALAVGSTGNGGAGIHREVHYHLEANYRYQDEVSMADDVRFLSMLSG